MSIYLPDVGEFTKEQVTAGHKPKGGERPSTKICLGCGETKDIFNDFTWVKEWRGRPAYPGSRCFSCARKFLNDRRHENAERYNAYAREGKKRNHAAITLRRKEAKEKAEAISVETEARQPSLRVCNKCREEKNTRGDFYPTKDGVYATICKPCQYAASLKWAIANPDKRDAAARKWREANPAKVKAAAIKSKAKNYAAWYAAYSATEERRSALNHYARQRRARIKNAWVDGSEMVTKDWFNEICSKQGNKCAYCDFTGILTMDHIHPIFRGGKHVRENICAACKPCNSSKADKMAGEWRPWLMIDIYGLDCSAA